MDISLIRGIIAVFEWLGINIEPYDALLLIGLCFVGYISVLIAHLKTRLQMHADHFDVLDDTHTESLKQSSRALELAADANGSVRTILSILKKKS